MEGWGSMDAGRELTENFCKDLAGPQKEPRDPGCQEAGYLGLSASLSLPAVIRASLCPFFRDCSSLFIWAARVVS